jgi:hypothetical protein
MRRCLSPISSLLILLGSTIAFAETPAAAGSVAPVSAPEPPVAISTEPQRLRWNEDWPRFSAVEAWVTVTSATLAAGMVLGLDAPSARWRGGILFDEGVQKAVRLERRAHRERAILASDLLYYGMVAYPVVVDSLLVAGAVHGSSDVMAQTMLMDVESYAVTGFLATAAENLGRVRPMQSHCDKDPDFDVKCREKGANNYGFLSGHTAAAWAGAGLVCAHHQNLPLYGGGTADALACAGGVIVAATSGVLRIATDNHYASDIVLGTTLGFTGGYFLPMALHYGRRNGKPGAALLPSIHVRSQRDTVLFAWLVPDVTPSHYGAAVGGVF